MGKMGDIWRGLKTSTKKGETEHGVIYVLCLEMKYCLPEKLDITVLGVAYKRQWKR
jgi:hypothetical protein